MVQLSQGVQIVLFVLLFIFFLLLTVGFYYLQQYNVEGSRCPGCGDTSLGGRNMAKLATLLTMTFIFVGIVLSGVLFEGRAKYFHFVFTSGIGVIFTILYGVGLGFLSHIVFNYNEKKCKACLVHNIHERNISRTGVVLLWILYVCVVGIMSYSAYKRYVELSKMPDTRDANMLDNYTRVGAPGVDRRRREVEMDDGFDDGGDDGFDDGGEDGFDGDGGDMEDYP